jgi:hypothetical protein
VITPSRPTAPTAQLDPPLTVVLPLDVVGLDVVPPPLEDELLGSVQIMQA